MILVIYLNNFPQWDFVEAKKVKLHAVTDVRESYFKFGIIPRTDYIPEGTAQFLLGWIKTDHYHNIINEFSFNEEYKKQYAGLKHPPIFTTVDAVVIKSGHVLLVKRRSHPGKGLLALPGGFLKYNETLVDAVIRELKEETKLKVPPAVLRGSLKYHREFDNPGRSLRGRTVTHAYLFLLNNGPLDKVKGSDDAGKAFWLPLHEALQQEEEYFEDHHMILTHLFSKIDE